MSVIIYAHTSAPAYIRCRKNIDALLDAGHVVYFFGARRNPGPKDDFPARERLQVRYFKGEMKHGVGSLLSLLGYLRELRREIIAIKPDFILLTNEELFAALIGLDKSHVVLDAIDALDIRVSVPWPVKQLLRWWVNYARSRARVVIEMEDFRAGLRPQFLSKTIVVRNTPRLLTAPGGETLKQDNSSPYIYAGGTFGPDNGLATLIEACRDEDVRILVAGYIADAALLEHIRAARERVMFLGPVSHAESLRYGRKSIAIFAHYRPVNLNFILAAPNKVYEAFALGVPVLINAEAKISDFCSVFGFGYSSKFGDVAGLRALIRRIVQNPLDSKAKHFIVASFNAKFAWEHEQEKLVKIFGDVDNNG